MALAIIVISMLSFRSLILGILTQSPHVWEDWVSWARSQKVNIGP